MNESLTCQNFKVGVEDFEKLITQRLAYIDKTSYLEDLIKRSNVALILRPRRFGKTLTMSMLSCFLEMNYQNPEDRSRPERLFKDLDVYKNRAFCNEYMGRFPVISLTFKDAEGANFREAVNRIIAVFAKLARKFDFLTKKDNLDTSFLRRIRDLNDGKRPVFGSDGNFDGVNNNLILDFLTNLADCLNQAFNKAPVLIIDEYDVPLQKARKRGYYDQMLEIIRGIMSSALKTNSSMEMGFVTGCLRIAHQSIFTGVNNFKTYGIQDEFLSGFIGLTRDDTIRLLGKCGLESRMPDVSEWYDGYNFAENDMLCPWSALNFAGDALGSRDPAAFQPRNYWANSSGNDIIEICMKHPRPKDAERFQNLLEGKTEEIALREFTTYPAIT
ncbi:AAA family ATPase, partial [Succinimonas sp.]|uniref:AAA family ATPase n=1 Tax=Succinimonas sp. TaxID=1936151 RepID=UPI00386A92C1